MRRVALLASTAVIGLIFAAGALAAGNFFQGNAGAGHIEFHVLFHNGKPKKVEKLAWDNLPTPAATGCSGGATSNHLKDAINVSAKGKFHDTQAFFSIGNNKAKVTGKFKDHAKKATGTLDVHTTLSGGGPNCDTGVVAWSAHK